MSEIKNQKYFITNVFHDGSISYSVENKKINYCDNRVFYNVLVECVTRILDENRGLK